MRLSGGKRVDAGSRGNSVMLARSGKSRRATAPYFCPVDKTKQYKAWVDVDLLRFTYPPDLGWPEVLTVACG